MRQKMNMVVAIAFVVSTLLAGHFASAQSSKPAKYNSNEVVLTWNMAAYNAMGEGYLHALLAARINAMVHLAMHDAINATNAKYETYLPVKKEAGADPEAAAAVAAHTVLVSCMPDKKNMLDSLLTTSLARIAEGNGKKRGIAIGKTCGDAIIANRAGDGADKNPVDKLEASTAPGVYNIVPPFDFVFAPYWKTMKLFSLKKHDQFRSVPPPALNSKAYTDAFNEVKAVGGINSSTRTPDQTSYAKFWYEYSEIGWNRMARIVTVDRKLDLHTSARLFALLNMALADSYSAGWDSKFNYNFWRPYTAIRAAANDGNPNTEPDTSWTSQEPTPPVPDYPSTHSVLGSAGATVLASVLGDNTSIVMVSKTPGYTGSTRTYKSFSEAAYENADSRLRAGIHFRFAFESGLEMGKQIGKWTVENHLKPLK